MEIVDESDYNLAKNLPAIPVHDSRDSVMKLPSDEDFKKLMEEMKDPMKAQRNLAARLKFFLDARLKDELESKGTLSDHTRRWVREYNIILENINKGMFGDKSVNLHLHQISHSQIASKIREVNKC